jgi:hypothetical protein
MKDKFIIVLFKNKEYFKKTRGFNIRKQALAGFSRMVDRSNLVKFPVEFMNRTPIEFEVGLLEKDAKNANAIYVRDEMGRNVKQTVDEENYTLIKVAPFKIEETFWDKTRMKKIDTDEFIKRYLNVPKLKVLTKLNNKIVYEVDGKYQLFGFKTEDEASRFMDCLWLVLRNGGRQDIMMLKDFTEAQKETMYELLDAKGFDGIYLRKRSMR